jgi:hypothetical protein
LFARRQQGVELPLIRLVGQSVRQRQELVRRVAHSREHGHDAVAGLARGGAALGDSVELGGVGDRRAAELHHHEPRGRSGVVDGRDGLVLDGRHAEKCRE